MGQSQSCDMDGYILKQDCDAKKVRKTTCDYSQHRRVEDVNRLYTRNDAVAQYYTANDVLKTQYVANSIRDQNYTSKQTVVKDYLPRTEVEKRYIKKAFCKYSNYVPKEQYEKIRSDAETCNLTKDKMVTDGVAAKTCNYAGGLELMDQLRRVNGRCPPTALCCKSVDGVDQSNCPAGIQNGYEQDGIRITHDNTGLCSYGVDLCG